MAIYNMNCVTSVNKNIQLFGLGPSHFFSKQHCGLLQIEMVEKYFLGTIFLPKLSSAYSAVRASLNPLKIFWSTLICLEETPNWPCPLSCITVTQ